MALLASTLCGYYNIGFFVKRPALLSSDVFGARISDKMDVDKLPLKTSHALIFLRLIERVRAIQGFLWLMQLQVTVNVIEEGGFGHPLFKPLCRTFLVVSKTVWTKARTTGYSDVPKGQSFAARLEVVQMMLIVLILIYLICRCHRRSIPPGDSPLHTAMSTFTTYIEFLTGCGIEGISLALKDAFRGSLLIKTIEGQ